MSDEIINYEIENSDYQSTKRHPNFYHGKVRGLSCDTVRYFCFSRIHVGIWEYSDEEKMCDRPSCVCVCVS